MKKPLFYALFLIFCWSCNTNETENDDVITLCDNSDHPEATYSILPLGASRVEGAAPEYFSFRHKLWENLIENDWSVDFIGTQCDDYNYDSSVVIDRNHEGYCSHCRFQFKSRQRGRQRNKKPLQIYGKDGHRNCRSTVFTFFWRRTKILFLGK